MAKAAAERVKTFAREHFTFDFKGQTEALPSAGSSFKAWQNVSAESLCVAEGRSQKKLDPLFVITNIPPPQAEDNSNTNNNTNQIYEGKGEETGLNLNESAESIAKNEKKMKRILANRRYALRYRIRRSHYMADLEYQKIVLEETISEIYEQIEDSVLRQESMLMEQRQLQLQMAALEQDRAIKEVEIAHNKEEVTRLTNELQLKHYPRIMEHDMDLNADASDEGEVESDSEST